MSRDYIDIGPTPAEEDCAQVGSPDYESRARPECIRFIDLIRRTLGAEPARAALRVKSNPHDFGAYLSVVCYYDDDDQESSEYAYRCEEAAPSRWDTQLSESGQLVTARASQVCGSCLAAAEAEGIAERESQEPLMMELGADVADHLCDQVEAPGLGLQCRCGCRSR